MGSVYIGTGDAMPSILETTVLNVWDANKASLWQMGYVKEISVSDTQWMGYVNKHL